MPKIQQFYSNAKINICLQILNKRTDNFHNINSLFYNIPLCDKIIISEHNSLELACNVDLGINQEKNLVYKAAQELLKKIHKPYTAKIQLIKNIPSGAGLGGGSSNAATALLGLNEFWNTGLNQNELLEIAAKLGSDVPFFIYNSPAIVSGRGEIIELIDFKLNYYCLIVFPNIYINTSNAYSLLKREQSKFEIVDIKAQLKKRNGIKNILINDFENVIFENHPEMQIIKNKLMYLSNGLALMSGSGSSFFALFETESSLQKAQEKFVQSSYFTYTCMI